MLQTSPAPLLCKVDPSEDLLEKCILVDRPIASFIIGNKPIIKLFQVLKPMKEFNLHVMVQEMEMGFLQHILTLIPGKGQTTKMMRKIGWNLREEAKSLPPFDECPTPYLSLIMNIITWNCKGALKPSFQKHVRDLMCNHDPAVFIVIETRIGGDRAAEITEKLPFDGVIHTDTIGYVGDLWVLWNSDKVEVALLIKTEQEIHVSIKVVRF